GGCGRKQALGRADCDHRPVLLRARVRAGAPARARALLGARPGQKQSRRSGPLCGGARRHGARGDRVRGADPATPRSSVVDRLARLVGFLVLAPRMLLHRRVARRDLIPGAVFTVLGLITLRLISGLLLVHWLNWYSTTYGSFGIVIALFFWIIAFGTVLILAA